MEKIEAERARERQEATLPKKGEKGFKSVNVGGHEPTTLEEKGRAIEIAVKKARESGLNISSLIE